jgi:hypothetical protein
MLVLVEEDDETEEAAKGLNGSKVAAHLQRVSMRESKLPYLNLSDIL